MLMLTGWLTQGAITTESFWFALLAGLVISIVNTILSAVLLENK
jgi:uncharacterized membrane protein YvlD (DUF360 family)